MHSQYSLVFLPGLLFGRLFDLGHFRVPFLVSSILLVLATFLIAECTKYWHFVICQGIAIGVRAFWYKFPCCQGYRPVTSS